MATDIDTLLQSYTTWLGEQIKTRTIGEYQEITTPFLDRHNDCIQLYLKKLTEQEYLLSDGGYTIQDLESCGCRLDTEKRQELLNETLAGLGVSLSEDNELQVITSRPTFPQKKHNLIQAVLAVNDLTYTSKQNVGQMFTEDVKHWLTKHNIRYSTKISLVGKSGMAHSFELVIPPSPDETTPERLIQTYNNLTLQQIEALAFRWNDVRQIRPSKLYVITSSSRSLSKGVEDVCNACDIMPIAYENLDTIAPQLTA